MSQSTKFPTCPGDEFPLIDLYGATVCSAEHADAIIGGQRVVDAKTVDGYLHLIFENGASMPLTCPCCAGKLHLRSISLDNLSQMLSGRKVEGFRHGEWVSSQDRADRHPIFAVQFAGEEDLSARTVQIHLESVRRIADHRSTSEVKSQMV